MHQKKSIAFACAEKILYLCVCVRVNVSLLHLFSLHPTITFGLPSFFLIEQQLVVVVVVVVVNSLQLVQL